jgi:methylase of polypeptide subunit release factors
VESLAGEPSAAGWVLVGVPHTTTRHEALSTKGRVLDVGWGEGAQLVAVREAGCEAIGLDLAPEAARGCRAMGYPVFIGHVSPEVRPPR